MEARRLAVANIFAHRDPESGKLKDIQEIKYPVQLRQGGGWGDLPVLDSVYAWQYGVYQAFRSEVPSPLENEEEEETDDSI